MNQNLVAIQTHWQFYFLKPNKHKIWAAHRWPLSLVECVLGVLATCCAPAECGRSRCRDRCHVTRRHREPLAFGITRTEPIGSSVFRNFGYLDLEIGTDGLVKIPDTKQIRSRLIRLGSVPVRTELTELAMRKEKVARSRSTKELGQIMGKHTPLETSPLIHRINHIPKNNARFTYLYILDLQVLVGMKQCC
jgi:hypothetical protein